MSDIVQLLKIKHNKLKGLLIGARMNTIQKSKTKKKLRNVYESSLHIKKTIHSYTYIYISDI